MTDEATPFDLFFPAVHEVRLGRIWIAYWRWGGCFRILGRGLHLRRTIPGEPILFSERYGYTKVWKFAGWRLKVLKP